MECLSGFASSIARDLACAAVDELRYPCCFNNLVDDLQKEQDKVVETRNSVQERTDHAKKQTKKTDGLDKWLTEANNDIDNVKELLKEAKKNKSCCSGQCANWIWRYRVGKRLAESKRTITKRNKEGRKHTQIERLTSLPGLGYFRSERCLKFDSRQHAYDQLQRALEDDEVNMIGLYGMGGCGKSTLATEVGKRAKKEKLFDEVVLVSVSFTVDVQRIQDEIASSLECELLEKGEMRRAQRVHKRLTQEEKVLVILDNVWEKLNFEAIGIPYRENHKGCKVLITTRSEDVCKGMDCKQIIRLEVLEDEEAWDLFQRQAQISGTTSEDLKHLARQISDGCKGLPVAIAALASTLKGKDIVQWNVALRRLTGSNYKQINIEKTTYECLQLSYDNLEFEEEKSLLLLCSVFPEDYEISVEFLTRFAIGLGLIGEVHLSEASRDEIFTNIYKLKSAFLLLDSSERKFVKMHNLIHKVALWIAEDEGKGIKCALEKDVTLECTLPRYLWCEKFPCQLDCSNLEFMCIETYLEVFHEIFKDMKKLKVLFLINKGLDIRSLSTKSFNSLTNLRCLILEYWELGIISFLGDLEKLESYTLYECSVPELPNIGVAPLPKLRLLDILGCYMEKTPFEVIGRYPQLQELYIDDCSLQWNLYDERTVVGFFSKFSVPQALKRYRIHLGTLFLGYEEKFLNCCKTLFLSCFDTSNVSMKDLAKKAEVLFIANIQGGAKNIIPNIFQLDGRGMNELIELWIKDFDGIEHLVDTSNHLREAGTFFSKLCMLKIEGLKHLRSLYHGQPPDSLFEKVEELHVKACPELHGTLIAWKLNLCSLKVLELSQCPKLTSLFTTAVAQSLVQLEKIEIIDCDGLKHIIVDDDNKDMLVFPKLKQLSVRACKMLEYIFPITYAQGLLQLECLVIESAWQLKYIFGQFKHGGQEDNHQSQNEFKIKLPLLKRLTLYNLPNIINICPDNYCVTCSSLQRIVMEDVGLSTLSINNLMVQSYHSFTSLDGRGMNELIELWIKDSDGIEHLVDTSNHLREVGTFFSKLGMLKIERMEHLRSLYHGQPPNSLFEKVEELHVEDCPELHGTLIVWKLNLYSLKVLELSQCPKMTSLFTTVVARSLGRLEKIEIIGCDGLKHIIVDDDNKDTLVFPKLKQLSVRACKMLEYIIPITYAQGLLQLECLVIESALQLKYIFGQFKHGGQEDNHQSQNEFKIELPLLERLTLSNLPNIINICPDNYCVTCSSLQRIVMENVGLSTLSINNLMVQSYHSFTSEIEVASKKNELMLGYLAIWNSSKIKGIFHLDELPINSPQATSWLIDLNLVNLPDLNYIWKGAKHSVTLQNLKLLYIWGTKKLKIIFSSSVSRCLPQLKILVALQCEGLEQIFEDDNEEHENVSKHQSQKICFLKLKLLLITHCNNLKRLFYLSTSHEFPELEYLIINQDPHLEQVFEGVRERRVEVLLPKLKYVILMQLPNLINVPQWIEFQNVTNLFVHNCPKLSLTSTTTVEHMLRNHDHDRAIDFLVRCDLLYIRDTINKEIAEMNPEDQNASKSDHDQMESGDTESHKVLNTGTQDSPTLKPKLVSHDLTKSVTGKAEEVPVSDSGPTKESTTSLPATLDKISSRKLMDQQTTNESSCMHQRHELGETIVTAEVAQISIIPSHDSIEGIIKESVQECSTLEDAKKAATTEGNAFGVVVVTHIKPSDGDTIAQHSQLVGQGDKLNEDETGTTPCQNIQNVGDSIQEGSNTMDKEGEISVVSNDSSEVPPDTSGRHSLMIAEFGAYKNFGGMDDERIALLVEAIEVYPQLWNFCEKFSKSFQAFMLQALADMLLFLRNESAYSVTPQRVKEFHILCDVAVQLGFERSWVDRMRQRVTVKDPKVKQVQEQLSELLKRRDQLSQELHKIEGGINRLNDYIAVQNKCFDFL